jgi:hypothetical protein
MTPQQCRTTTVAAAATHNTYFKWTLTYNAEILTSTKRDTRRIKAINKKFLRNTEGKTRRISWNYLIFGSWPLSENLVIWNVIHHHQNPFESIRREGITNYIFQEVRIQNMFRVKR